MEIQELVKNFLSSPYQLSALGNIEGNRYYDYLALFHIILVKKEEKKGFVIPELRNGTKICKKLKLPYEAGHPKNVMVASKDNKIPDRMTRAIIKFFADQIYEKHIVCSNDLASCDGSIVEDVEEYPVCCVNSFNENKWNDLTRSMEYVDENMKEIQTGIIRQSKGEEFRSEEEGYVWMANRVVGKIIEKAEDSFLNKNIFNATQSIKKEYIQTREKYPFVFHQACSDCLSDSNSSSAKLNSRWCKLCQEEFPDLYHKITKEVQLHIKNELDFWGKTWEQHLDAMEKQCEAETGEKFDRSMDWKKY